MQLLKIVHGLNSDEFVAFFETATIEDLDYLVDSEDGFVFASHTHFEQFPEKFDQIKYQPNSIYHATISHTTTLNNHIRFITKYTCASMPVNQSCLFIEKRMWLVIISTSYHSKNEMKTTYRVVLCHFFCHSKNKTHKPKS